ncbi:hypothetical protein PHLGIDRAFT_169058 [Phlebiopsis gigantea 11061_1 CR5-6]|uniref:GmrSD restriction endonucleases N-terminal domain-containing protein n=1 Tax=Phlebiopsis gigantea (strain 11061_1 CR5-6) TaxID=745531 RepID=A0A0C3S4K6_PHLG1|nr:hypothetical protein PHLGIDRAFT_169058 [Phlebiopsis gigantea 11061_1 CR5-6]
MALSDWESDLTELDSSSDEEYVPQKKRGRPPGPVKEYKINNYLRPPRSTNQSIRSLYDLLVEGTIDLDPVYQRDVVWPETKQAGLIDSMLRNYYIPPVIFARKWNKHNEQDIRVCIDGKQRLTSIRRFMDGEIAHRDSQTGKKYWYKSTAGGKRPVLSQRLVQSFLMAQIVCVEYDDITEEQEREIFQVGLAYCSVPCLLAYCDIQRVQMGVALTPAERMQAVSGPWPDLVREIQSVVIGEEGFSGALEWGSSRGRDFQCLAMIVYMLQGHPKFPVASQIEKWLSNSDPVPSKLRIDILETFKIFVHLAKERKYTTCFQKPSRISPVEFIMTGVCIHTLRNKLSFTQLASAIAKMREDVRAKHVDVRANQRVVKTMQTFLKKLSVSSLNSDPLDKKPASVALKSVIRDAQSTKRKRGDDSDDEEGRRPTASKISKVSRVTKQGKAAPKSAPKTSTSKTSAKGNSASGSKTIVKKVSTTMKKTTAPATRDSAMELPANKHLPLQVKSSQPTRQPASASASTSTTPQPPPSSSVITSSHPDQPTRVSTSLQQVTTGAPHGSSEETIIPGSLSRRRSAEEHGPCSEAAAAPAQQAGIKPDPDAPPSISGVLAIIRKAKISPDCSVSASSIPSAIPTTSLAQQGQAIQQAMSVSAPPMPPKNTDDLRTSMSPERAPPLPRVATEPSIPADGPHVKGALVVTASPASMKITAAQVQSILAKAGVASQQQPERRSTVDIVPRAADDTDTATSDPRRRPSTSPNQTFSTPSFINGVQSPATAATASSLPPLSTTAAEEKPPLAVSPVADLRQSPTATAPMPLSPTLPKKPEIPPPHSTASSTDILAVPINPQRRSPDIPRAPRADREREWNGSGGNHGKTGARVSRWDQPHPSPAGWRGGMGGGGAGVGSL